MTPNTDHQFRLELASVATASFLSKALKFQLCVLLLLIVTQIGLLVWVAGQCSNIYGLSVEGRIFSTHSFTCPNPSVEPLYHSAPRRK